MNSIAFRIFLLAAILSGDQCVFAQTPKIDPAKKTFITTKMTSYGQCLQQTVAAQKSATKRLTADQVLQACAKHFDAISPMISAQSRTDIAAKARAKVTQDLAAMN